MFLISSDLQKLLWKFLACNRYALSGPSLVLYLFHTTLNLLEFTVPLLADSQDIQSMPPVGHLYSQPFFHGLFQKMICNDNQKGSCEVYHVFLEKLVSRHLGKNLHTMDRKGHICLKRTDVNFIILQRFQALICFGMFSFSGATVPNLPATKPSYTLSPSTL